MAFPVVLEIWTDDSSAQSIASKGVQHWYNQYSERDPYPSASASSIKAPKPPGGSPPSINSALPPLL